MALVHVVRSGETLLAIAEQYGFRAWQTIADAPENADLLAERGNPHAVREGDELHIPDAQRGECLVPAGDPGVEQTGLAGTAKHHKAVLKTHKPLLEVRVYLEFRRVPDGVAAGAKNGTIKGWHNGTKHVTVKEASIAITPGTFRAGPTNREGIARFDALTEGTWTLSLQPHPDQTSPGPAMPDATRDHGRDWGQGNVVRKRTRSDSRFFDVEYRPLELEIQVLGGAIAGVSVTSKKPDDRPFHAVCFWHDGVEPGPTGVTQVLEIDLKPDFLRRVDAGGTGVHPLTHARAKQPGIRLFQIHHTGGKRISGAIEQFIGTTSGIHFINDRDGHVVRMVDDKYRVKHGGGEGGPVEIAWADEPKINDQAIGVENVQGGEAEFPAAQITALIGLVKKAREIYPAILINHVMSHADVYTGKLGCPGKKFPWPDLEDAGAALKPLAITDAQMETEWGGFFAAAAGDKRSLKEGDRDREDEGGTFSVVRGSKVIASGLSLAPIALLNEALHAIGYTPNRKGKRVADFDVWKTKHLGTFGASTRVSITFFKAHYCTEPRPATTNGPVVDATLAKLVLGCYRTLTA